MNEKLENGLVRPHWVLTDPDEMNAFALLVSQLHPVKMLDVGMFLKRIGAISRSFRNFEIPSDTELFGLDLTGAEVEIYHVLFRQIVTAQDYQEMYRGEQFDLVVLFEAEKLMDEAAYLGLWEWVLLHTKRIFTTDGKTAALFSGAIAPVTVNGREYYIL